MPEIQDHLSASHSPHGKEINFTLCCDFFFLLLTGKPLKTSMLFTDMSQLWTQSGLVEKQLHIYTVQYKSKVDCLIKNTNNFSKSDNIKTGKTALVQVQTSPESTERPHWEWKQSI